MTDNPNPPRGRGALTVIDTVPERPAARAARLLGEARLAARDHVENLEAALAEVITLASEIGEGGEAYPAGAPYDYVRRTYGVDPIEGQRVRLTEGRENPLGTIAKESPSHGHYVQVRFDGQKRASNCHPTSLEYLGWPS